jgi:hypothetical protein
MNLETATSGLGGLDDCIPILGAGAIAGNVSPADRCFLYSPSLCGMSATTYAITATAAAHLAMCTGSIRSTVSAGV